MLINGLNIRKSGIFYFMTFYLYAICLSTTVYITTRKVVQTFIFPIRNGIFLNQNILNNSLSILHRLTQSQNASKINAYRDMLTK